MVIRGDVIRGVGIEMAMANDCGREHKQEQPTCAV